MTEPKSPHKNWTLLAVCLGVFMLIVDMTIVVVALPKISVALHTSFSDVQWTVDAYSLSLASLLLPTGSLGDILGRRRVFAAGLAIFTLGSLLCAISGSGIELVIFRAFQGLGGATIFATSLALIAEAFHGRDRGFAFAAFGAVIAAAGGLGPLLGGVLTAISWRWIFYVNVPLGVFAIFVTLTFIRESRPPFARRIDVPGFAVFTAGLFCLVYGLIESSRRGWSSTLVIAMLIAAVVLLVSFPLLERMRAEPMFDLSLFRKPAFLGGSIAAFGMNASLYALLLYFTLYLQDYLRISALGTGLRLAVMTAMAMATAIPAGRFSAHISVRFLIGPGLVLVGVGLLLMRGITPDSTWTHLIPGLIVAGAGSGLVNAPLASTAVGVVPPRDAGMASGINSTFRQVGIAVAVAALGSIFSSRLAHTTAATAGAHYSSAMNVLLLIGGLTGVVTGVLALALIRRKDFLVHTAPPEPQPVPQS